MEWAFHLLHAPVNLNLVPEKNWVYPTYQTKIDKISIPYQGIVSLRNQLHGRTNSSKGISSESPTTVNVLSYSLRVAKEGWPGPYWLLKLRWMGTQRMQMKLVLPWLVCWACRASTIDYTFCLGCSSRPSTKYFFPPCALFQFFVPIGQQAGQWADSRAGSPVS